MQPPDAWNTRSPANESIVRVILDGIVVRVLRPLLVVISVRAEGQKILLAM